MYAIIRTGGKQYRVAVGDVIDVELLKEEIGTDVIFAEVLFCANDSDTFFGEPTVADCFVVGEHLEYVSGPKVVSMKYIPGNHRKKIGHRQHYSRVMIKEIQMEKQKKVKHGT